MIPFVVGAGISAVSSLVGGFSSYKSSKRQKRAYEAQARFNREQAQFERELGEFDANQQARIFDRLISKQKMSFAASGIAREGTALDILEESARDKRETLENIKKQTESRARALEFGAAQAQQQGRDTVRAGRNALIGSIFGAAAGGLQNYATYKQFSR